MNLKTSLAVAGVAVLLAFLTWGLVSKGHGGLEIGEPVPDATLPVLAPKSAPETTGSLSRHRGKWVLLNVWASWCIPCREESPALQRFARAHRRDLTVLGVDTRDLTSDGLDFVHEYSIRYPQLRDADGKYADDLGTTGVPESFLVDPDGNLEAHFPGPFRDEASIAKFAAPAVKGS